MAGKYGAKKKIVDGIKFDSTMEANYYEYLKAEKASGRIKDFELQPVYLLQEAYSKNGRKVQAIKYIADFKIYYKDGSHIVIDVKGKETEAFKIKRKLFDYRYSDEILKLVIWSEKSGWIDFDENKRNRAKKIKAEKLNKKKKAS